MLPKRSPRLGKRKAPGLTCAVFCGTKLTSFQPSSFSKAEGPEAEAEEKRGEEGEGEEERECGFDGGLTTKAWTVGLICMCVYVGVWA